MISQRNCGQFIRSPPIVRKIIRKVHWFFHYFEHIEKNASQLFCTGDIKTINQQYTFMKNMTKNYFQHFISLQNFFEKKNVPEEKNIKLDRKY